MNTSIYKILTETQWRDFEATGFLLGTPADLRDGFIHLSGRNQVDGVIARHYANQRPLYLVEFLTEPLGEDLRWEMAPNGERFPHLYGRPLKRDEVLSYGKI